MMNRGKEVMTSQGAMTMNTEQVKARLGRPRAIGESVIPKVISLYRKGLGYRAIARELAKEGLCVDWSTVRRVVKAHQSNANEKMASGDF
jgi:hypothetical protein